MLLIITVLILILSLYFYEWYKKNLVLPPGPWGIPVLGMIPFINFKDPKAAQERLKEQYGPVVSMRVGSRLVLYLLDYDAVRESFEKQAEIFAGRFDFLPLNAGCQWLGIVMAQGVKWQRARRFAQSTLRDFGMGKLNMEPKIHEEIEAFGKPFQPNFALITSNVIANIIFGHRYEYSNAKFLDYQTKVCSLFNMRSSLILASHNSWFKYLPQFKKDKRELINDLKIMWKYVEDFIDDCKIDLDKVPTDFLSAMFQEANSSKENHDLYFERIPDGSVNTITIIVTQLFAAGTETTATTIEWAFAVLLKYPDIQGELQQEIDEQLGSVGLASYDERAKLPLCEAFCMEVQRFGNIAATCIPHETTEDTYLRQYFIPKGTVVLTGQCTIMNDTRYFDDPSTFNPRRFIDEQGKVPQRPQSFLPFSAGKRICLGDSLAKREIFICVVALLQKYNFSTPDGDSPPSLTPSYQITTRPQPYQMVVTKRF